mmetsp:Transcript_24750/g.34002  ORF Transcript_24750/g.34002 Transcript_24750/m.34002 type:complete len:140 (-) Transcript_24750:202-621(-)
MEVTKAMLTSSPKSHRLKVLLQIMYLRTYHNAGTAEVLLDGQRVAVLDALHPNFVRFPYSIEELLTLQLEVQQVPSKVEILWRFDNYSSLPGRGACATEDTEWRRKGLAAVCLYDPAGQRSCTKGHDRQRHALCGCNSS